MWDCLAIKRRIIIRPPIPYPCPFKTSILRSPKQSMSVGKPSQTPAMLPAINWPTIERLGSSTQRNPTPRGGLDHMGISWKDPALPALGAAMFPSLSCFSLSTSLSLSLFYILLGSKLPKLETILVHSATLCAPIPPISLLQTYNVFGVLCLWKPGFL